MTGEPVGMSTRELLLELRADLAQLRNDLRETRHEIRNDLRGIELRVIELEAFRRDAERRFTEGERLAEQYVPMIDYLASQEKIEDAVRQALSESDTRGWTRRERIMGVGLFVFSLVGAAGTVISVIVLGSNGGP